MKKSTKENDPGLHTGLAYFIDHEKYIQHVCKYASQKDVGCYLLSVLRSLTGYLDQLM